MSNKQARQRAPKTGANMEQKKKGRKLTLKQEAFAEHYIANGGNGVKAAEAAGYAGDYATLGVTAHDNLKNPKILEFTRERLKGVKATSDEVLVLLADHLRSDIAVFEDCVKEDGSLDLKKARRLGASHLIKKLKVRSFRDKDGNLTKTTEIELHDSQSAAAKLGDYLGLKQMPRVNQEDVARVNAEIARLVAAGWEPEDAKQIVIEAEPTAATWLH